MKQVKIIFASLILVLSSTTAFANTADNTRYVDPFIGTTNYSVCNPGAVRPHALMSVGLLTLWGPTLTLRIRTVGGGRRHTSITTSILRALHM